MTDPTVQLRPAQADILQYDRGRMAVSAVPGSGKTFTLSLLAAQLIASKIDPERQQILIVTYLNASVDTFKARIRKRLLEMGLLPDAGFDVRTLHSLALEIVRVANSGTEETLPVVLDETQANLYLNQAIDGWIENNRALWHEFLSDESPQLRAKWRTITENTAKTFIRTAKNERYQPYQISAKLNDAAANQPNGNELALTWMLSGIYDRYQTILARQAALDFDDLIWRATDLLERRADLTEILRQRWPYVLEDEAQDSVPLQEVLLSALTGREGNWVRVGDPNQAITSTFTAAHPRFFNAFLDQPDVLSRPLPNSGRSAPLIIGAANSVVHWVCDSHPVPEVQQHAFRRQDILPTPPGDAQPNPPDSEAHIAIKVFRHREEEELPGVARQAMQYAKQHPEHTLAILVPTNNLGHQIAEQLDELDADYDNLLRGGGRERQIAAALHAMLALLADPLNTRALTEAYAALHEMGHPALGSFRPSPNGSDEPDPELERFYSILRSTHSPERLLFPREDEEPLTALPAGVATEDDASRLEPFLVFLRHLFTLRTLPIDDLALALGDELFAWGGVHEADLSLTYQMANILRRWRDQQPDWRLPDLAAQLADVARGRRSLPLAGPNDLGYEPQPGRITLSTQHSAKGLEWDAVFLVGVDGTWIPGSLDAYFQGDEAFLGGDPNAEAVAQLRFVMAGAAGIYPHRTATETAHIEIICERLRLLYVGITRARRFLQLSRSRATRRYNKEQTSEPATVMGVIYKYLQSQQPPHP